MILFIFICLCYEYVCILLNHANSLAVIMDYWFMFQKVELIL